MKRHIYSTIGPLTLLLALAFVSGCTDTESEPSTGSESHWLTCNTDNDCPTGQACVGQRCAPAEGGDATDVADGAPGADGSINAICTGQWGGCTGSDEQGFDCQCTYYDASRTNNRSSCGQAHNAACDPTSNTCGGFQGFCDPVDDASPPGVQCHCMDGETPFRSYNDLGHDDCASALVELCGPDEPPEDYGCGATNNDVTKECTLLGKAEEDNDAGALQFECTCSVTCPGEQGDTTGSFVADTCAEALDQICPDAC